MAYKTALFDLDGTLVQTERRYYLTVTNDAAREIGIPFIPDELVDDFWNALDRSSFIETYFGIPSMLFWAALRKHENIELRKECTTAYPDSEYLCRLREMGFKLGLVSGASQRFADFETKLLPLEFDAVVLAKPAYGVKEKPDPEGISKILEMLNADNLTSFYVGNSAEDILAGKAAGVLDILIERGYKTCSAEPSIRIKTLYDLESIIT